MIIVRLRGGLGNQLFQYAAGRALAERHDTELALDLYTYTKHKYRRFELDHFNIRMREATRDEVHRYTGSNMLVRYLNKRENYFRCPRVFAQPHYHYYDDFHALPDDLYLTGYWQSEKYFQPIADKIKAEFAPKIPLDAVNESWRQKMESVNSVSIHIRRGDYAASSYQAFFGVLPMTYYQNAIQWINEKAGKPRFFFFSDDPEWCRQNFGDRDAEFISHNQGTAAFKDMMLMSACRHHIIANSTFSWWGAWLDKKANGHVIAPAQWFRTNYLDRKEPVYASRFYNTKDLLPSEWIRL